MTTLVEEPATDVGGLEAAARLRATMAAMRLSFTWFGVRKALSDEQKAGAAEAPRRLGEVLVEMGEVTPDQIERGRATQPHHRDRAERAGVGAGGMSTA